MAISNEAKEAYQIATRAFTHRDALYEIIRRGLADDEAPADALIREGEDEIHHRS